MKDDPPIQDHPGESFLSIILSGLAGLAFLTFLIVITGGYFLGLVAMLATAFLIALFHYLLWGHTLNEEVAEEREREEDRARAEAEVRTWPVEDPFPPRGM